MDVHVGRQPVFDRAGHVIGHELLFRDGQVGHARFASGSKATAQVVLGAFLDVGLDRLVGDGVAFLNLPRPFVTGALPLPPDGGRLVLEVLEDVGHDDELKRGVQRLRDEGHRLALDDFVWTSDSAALIPLVDIVKLDVLDHGDALPDLVRRLQDTGVEIVAEKVQTEEQLALCRELGVDYYQGYLLQRPSVLRARTLSARQMSCLGLVRALQSPGVTVDELVDLVRRDAGLSFRLLQAVNSAGNGLSRRISGLREALVLLGLRELRRWSLLMLVADLPEEAGVGVEAAFLRAAMCERLARDGGGADPAEAFVVGLLSSLPMLLGRPVEEVLALLPLAAETSAAVRHQEGPLGELLSCVLSYEDGVLVVPATSGLPAAAPREAFVSAVAESARVRGQLQAV